VGIVARFPRVATGQVDRLGMYRQLDINLREPRSQLLYEIAMPLEPAHDLGLGPNGHRRIFREGQAPRLAGPRLKGIVLPGGGDWTVARPDGSARLDVRITLRTDDDALVYTHYNGVLHAPAGVIGGGEPVDPVSIISAWCRSSKLPRRNTLG